VQHTTSKPLDARYRATAPPTLEVGPVRKTFLFSPAAAAAAAVVVVVVVVVSSARRTTFAHTAAAVIVLP